MRHRLVLAAATVLAIAGLAAPARAQDEGGQSLFRELNYCFSGGLMTGVGPQGKSLNRGPFFALNVNGENAIGLELGVEGAYAASDDPLRTTFSSISGIARLSPFTEDYRAYVQLGAGGYYATFNPKDAAVTKPESKFRPGGSFGVGLELIERSNFNIGGMVTYNGVLLGQNQGRSYLVAAVNLTFLPSRY